MSPRSRHSQAVPRGLPRLLDVAVDVAEGTQKPCDSLCSVTEQIDARGRVSPLPLSRISGHAGRPPGYAQPSCCKVMLSFQIFVMWPILLPSKSMT